MSEEVKAKRVRRPNVNVDVKVSPTDYDKLEICATSINSKPEKIIEDLISEYLDREDIKALLKQNGELIKLKEERTKMKSKLDRIDKRIEELEGPKK